MTTDPFLQQLSSEAAEKIKAIASTRDNQIQQIQQIYQDYREKAALIRAEASVESLDASDTDLRSEPHPHQQQTR